MTAKANQLRTMEIRAGLLVKTIKRIVYQLTFLGMRCPIQFIEAVSAYDRNVH